MSTSLEIFDTHIKVINENGTRYISQDELIKTIQEVGVEYSTPVLFNMLSYRKTKDKIKVVVYRKNENGMFSLNFSPTRNVNETEIRTINIPYMIYKFCITEVSSGIFSIDAVYLYCSYYEPKMDEQIFIPRMANIYEDGRICLGVNEVDARAKFTSWQHIDNVISTFQSSVFNNDLTSSDYFLGLNGRVFNSKQSWIGEFTNGRDRKDACHSR